MTIRNLLVAYNGLAASETALAGALAMQRRLDAHLTGLFAHGASEIAQHIKPWMPDSVKEALRTAADQSTTEIEARFRAAAADVPPEKLHWHDAEGAPDRVVAAYARLFDLTVMGMHEHAGGYDRSRFELHPDRIAFESGRPVIFFPPGFADGVLEGRAVLAWDGGRAAARALGDALAVLSGASEIEIVSVGRLPMSRTLAGVDVTTVLERHGLSVTLRELERGRKPVGEVLVEHCEAVGAGLLVMGAYEHSPLRETLIGGVTHDVSMLTRIPVMMSH